MGLLLGYASGCLYSVADVQPRRDSPSGGTNGGDGAANQSGAAGGGGSTAEVIALAADQAMPRYLTQDADDLYFTTADGVHRCAKSGEPSWLRKVTDGTELGRLVVDEAWVYFADPANSRVAKVEKAGGLAQSVVSAEAPFALATDGAALFYGALSGVFSVNKDGTGVRQLYESTATTAGAIADLVTTESEVIFSDSEARGLFAVSKLGDATPRLLSKLTGEVTGIAVFGESVFFRERVSSGGVLAVTAASSETRRDLLTDEAGPAGLAAGNGQIFFVNDLPLVAELRRYDVAGDEAVTIVAGRPSLAAVAVDDSAVYWTEPTAGRVMKLNIVEP